MKDEIKNFIKDQLNITENIEYRFREMFGFTFVFRETFYSFDEKVSSAEIKPAGIIYEENGEFYFAPLDEVNEIEAIVKEFVEIYLK